MRIRDYITSALFIVGFGFAFLGVFPYTASAYSHTGPAFSASYDIPLWNYGTGAGIVSQNQTADQINGDGIISGNYVNAIAQEDLLLQGTCIGCGMFNGTSLPSGGQFFNGVKVVNGAASRYFLFNGPMSNITGANVTSEHFCMNDPAGEYSGTSSYGAASIACGSGLSGDRAGATSQGICQLSGPENCIGQTYNSVAFVLTGACTTSLNGGSGAASVVTVADPAGYSGTTTTASTCNASIWSTMQSWITGGNFPAGFGVSHTTGSDCTNIAVSFFGATTGNYVPTSKGCESIYIADSMFDAFYLNSLPVTFGSQTVNTTVTLSPADTSTPVQQNLTYFRTALDQSQSGLILTWNCILDPVDYCPGNVIAPSECITLPQPGQNETAEDYRSRVRTESGYTGSVEFVDDTGYPSTYASGSNALGLTADTVTGVIVTNLGIPSTEHQYTQFGGVYGAWTNPAPQVCPPSVGNTSDIQIIRVPSTYTPPTTIGATAVGGGGGTSGTCSCGPVNFHPLTNINYGSHFPFGIFTYISGLFSDPSGSCTPGSGTCSGFMLSDLSFTNPLTSSTTLVPLNETEGPGGIWNTTYRPIVFEVQDFLMVVASIYFLGWRVIGIGSAGASGVEDDD